MKQARNKSQVGSMTIEQRSKPASIDTPQRLSLLVAAITLWCSIFIAAIVL